MRTNLDSISMRRPFWSLHEQLRFCTGFKTMSRKAKLMAAKNYAYDCATFPYPPVLPKFRNPKRPSETWGQRQWKAATMAYGSNCGSGRERVSDTRFLKRKPRTLSPPSPRFGTPRLRRASPALRSGTDQSCEAPWRPPALQCGGLWLASLRNARSRLPSRGSRGERRLVGEAGS